MQHPSPRTWNAPPSIGVSCSESSFRTVVKLLGRPCGVHLPELLGCFLFGRTIPCMIFLLFFHVEVKKLIVVQFGQFGLHATSSAVASTDSNLLLAHWIIRPFAPDPRRFLPQGSHSSGWLSCFWSSCFLCLWFVALEGGSEGILPFRGGGVPSKKTHPVLPLPQ